jgi:hypothetical protein
LLWFRKLLRRGWNSQVVRVWGKLGAADLGEGISRGDVLES